LLKKYAAHDPVQLNRIRRAERLHRQWVDFAEAAIGRRIQGLPIDDYVRSKSGLDMKDEQRKLLNDFIAYE
ncbi:hypothetical protein, partial [Pseudomonas syringae]